MSAVRAKKNPGSAKPTSSDAVATWVRERIRRGRLVPGQRLVEADVIAQTGASRGKVREALQRLQAEHLVTIEEFRGASVRQIGPQELHHIYRTRMVLEGLAAAEFAAADAPELKQRLQKLQDEMDRWRENGGHDRFAELNSQWHELIALGSGNTWLIQFLPSLTIPIYRLLFSSFYTDRRVDEANADHRKITAAIIDERAADAERAMREHISAGLTGVSELSARFID
ncbi:MAG TPA: GntR family transcriptional regulator [Gammaproteobacteria bacterium]|nr:GntR family transcriptional regulator [Gammaproteobacteria bacterium]